MESPVPPPQASDLKIPAELLAELHAANERFHAAKQKLEQTMDDTGYRHTERNEQEMENIRRAEREIEEIEAKIRQLPAVSGQREI
jgi:RNA polymerase-binding transcription factor DksA